jgi:hypothetical protein
MTFVNATQRFSNRVADYVRYRRTEESSFTHAYEGLLERFGTDYKNVKNSYPGAERIRFFISDFTERDLPNFQILDFESLSGRLRSSSFTPSEGHPDFAPVMAELQKIFRAYEKDSQVRMDYLARIYFGQVQAST